VSFLDALVVVVADGADSVQKGHEAQ
jgi:hypothetical protein